jgi:hypothetical protein
LILGLAFSNFILSVFKIIIKLSFYKLLTI